MKGNSISLSGVIVVIFASMAMSGCVSMMAPSQHMKDSMSYVRQHKGEGPRQSLLGSEAELIDSAVNFLSEGSYTIIREPHAVLAKASTVELSYAFYFYPSQTKNQTEVEVLMASPWLGPEHQQKFQKGHFIGAFPFSYINTRLLEEGYDPNVKEEGAMYALSTAAFYGYRETARKLVGKGANLDLAINELKETASRNVPYLGTPANKRTHDRANSGVEFLNRLKIITKQSENEEVSDARFQTALRAYQKTAIKPSLPETARRFMVQAGDAVREKKFDDAADLYNQALNIAPLWPEGHFNRALVLGETGNYESAAREMKRYLLLVPNAPNARAAQDKIYTWERKVGAGD